MIFGWAFPGAVPKASVDYGRWPIVGERPRIRVLTLDGPSFLKAW